MVPADGGIRSNYIKQFAFVKSLVLKVNSTQVTKSCSQSPTQVRQQLFILQTF